MLFYFIFLLNGAWCIWCIINIGLWLGEPSLKEMENLPQIHEQRKESMSVSVITEHYCKQLFRPPKKTNI